MAKAKPNTVYLAAFVPSDLAARIQQVARRHDRPVSSVIRQALHAYLITAELR